MEADGYREVQRAAGFILDAIEEGMSSAEFRSDIDPYLVRSMILGTIEHIFFRWHLKGRSEELADFVDPMLDVIISGIKKEEQAHSYQINITLPAEDQPAT